MKLYRRPDEAENLSATGVTKYQEPLADLSTTFKFDKPATAGTASSKR